MSSTDETQAASPVFNTTRWTLVNRAGQDSNEGQAALGELCEAYWTPVFKFLLRDGRNEDDSRELAQDFFARMLERGSVQGADQEKGRFRSYLLGALKHFLAERRRNENRQKRGGGAPIESIESGGSETSPGLAIPDENAALHDSYFDREWALNVLDRGLKTVQATFVKNGKGQQFEALKPWLMGELENQSQADVANKLGMKTGAVKVAIHRLRAAFRKAVEGEISQTIDDPEEVATELRHLIEALSH